MSQGHLATIFDTCEIFLGLIRIYVYSKSKLRFKFSKKCCKWEKNKCTSSKVLQFHLRLEKIATDYKIKLKHGSLTIGHSLDDVILCISLQFLECIAHYTFFIRKKFIRKWGSKSQNFKKMLRKSQGSSSTVHLFYVPEIDISSFFASTHTKIETFLWQSWIKNIKHWMTK